MKTLNALKEQCKKPELKCNPGQHCWCAQISFIFDEPLDEDRCLSPQEILDIGRDELTVKDQIYLESLLDREFIKKGH